MQTANLILGFEVAKDPSRTMPVRMSAAPECSGSRLKHEGMHYCCALAIIMHPFKIFFIGGVQPNGDKKTCSWQ